MPTHKKSEAGSGRDSTDYGYVGGVVKGERRRVRGSSSSLHAMSRPGREDIGQPDDARRIGAFPGPELLRAAPIHLRGVQIALTIGTERVHAPDLPGVGTPR